jgi:UDP-N-acetylmuramoyl-L-alanyl-D-glutamate--2,6-diaminopimelate ligase
LIEVRLREFLILHRVQEAEGDFDQEVTGLTYDSREVARGRVFFAVRGEKLDGHEFVSEALARGAAAVVVDRKAAWPIGTTWIRVNNVRLTMGLWGAHFFHRPSSRVKLVGITGTNGKTTTAYLVESILTAAGWEPGLIGTITYRYHGKDIPSHHTTPESLDLQALMATMEHEGIKSVVMEVSSHALVQERVRGLDFDVALFTNLSRDHLDYHVDMDDYFAAKSRLFLDYLPCSGKSAKTAVIHGDDARGLELIGKSQEAGLTTWSYGRNQRWDIYPLEAESDVRGLRGKIRVKDDTLNFSSRLIGSYNLENILGAVGVGYALGCPPKMIREGVERLTSVPGRLEKIANDRGINVVVDYAHTPDALEKVLGAVRPLTRGRLLAVFGCGGDRDRGKRPLMGEIAARLSDLVILTSDNPRTEDPGRILMDIEAGVRKTGLPKLAHADACDRLVPPQCGYVVEEDRRKAIAWALCRARREDSVVIAGKGHEDYQILGPKKIHFDDREIARKELSHGVGA